MPYRHRRHEAKLEAKSKNIPFSKRVSKMALGFCKETSLHGKLMTLKTFLSNVNFKSHRMRDLGRGFFSTPE